ncbi:MAG: phosphomethylpyrimidine synthase ThiC [Actinomycetota bacterium]
MSLLKDNQAGLIDELIEKVADDEHVNAVTLADNVAKGRVVIIKNATGPGSVPLGVGLDLRTKINANIGTSESTSSLTEELEKLNTAIAAGADAVMDLSTGTGLYDVLEAIMAKSTVSVGTVPVYGAAVTAIDKRGSIVDMTEEDLFGAVEEHCRRGVGFITVHCGVTLAAISALMKHKRVTDVVSRGGALLTGWMLHNERENPLYEKYDRLLDIGKQYDTVLSLGDGLRPGCLADATDEAQLTELRTLGELARRAREVGVQAMIEGPGHVPIHQIEQNVRLEKELCDGAPFYVLGPLVTDVAPGYDEITAAIGGAIAGAAGADFLCYVTPREHLGLPDKADVQRGVMASRIAAHAADLVKGVPGAADWDLAMSKARKNLDWEAQINLAIDPDRARRLHEERTDLAGGACTMCGRLCAMKVVAEYLGSPLAEKC